MQEKKELLFLIDGSSYLHRAFHALPPLISSKGKPTGAIYGVINMLKKDLNEYHPNYAAIIFDAPGKNFRHELYRQYKATRQLMKDDLKVQIDPLYNIIKAMGVPLLIVDGVEADDVIGTLVNFATSQKISVLISTSDKDMAQLVRPEVTLINTMINVMLDTEGVKEKFGVMPKQIVDYFTLVGDISDNIFGVSGVGPKTAVKWLTKYNNLNNIIKHSDVICGKAGENLRASLNQLPLVKKLLTIKDDVQLNIELNDFICKKANVKELITLFTNLEFRNWLIDLTKYQKTPHNTMNRCHIILTKEDFYLWLKKLELVSSFAFNVETNNNIIQTDLVGISFAVSAVDISYIPLGHTYDKAPIQLSRDYVLQNLKSIFSDSNKIKIGRNVKYNINVLSNYDIKVNGIYYDIMLESYILNSTNKHDIASMAFKYLGKTITTHDNFVGKEGVKKISFNQLKIETAASYAALNISLTIELHEALWLQISKIDGHVKILKEIEMPLIDVLFKMERYGVRVDEKILNKLSKEFKIRLYDLEYQIHQSAKTKFNINSPSQLQKILFDKLKLPILHKTPTGQPSTDESVLQELSFDYQLPRLILEYRSLSKLKSTYTDNLLKKISRKTYKIHTSYNQTTTITGRLSSTDPNLQNIPIRTEEGRKIRQAFIASNDCKIIAADYSQIELRIIAYLSQDENLLKAFQNGDDIHRSVAAEIFGIALEKVTDDMRRDAKIINFGIIYGMSAFGLAKRIEMSRESSQRYIDRYFARYSGMKTYIEKTKKFAYTNGFVETIFGRRLYLSDLGAKSFKKLATERVAVNASIQGSAADIIKIAMINIDRWLQNCDFNIAMIMQVHDELVFEVAVEHVMIAREMIRHHMEKAASIDMPIVVEVGIGDNWMEAH
ncbi:MAG: DNA polymerase I [Coxiellaceae bacterium]|jgi:DNA polymerase-1|nr:DNA polymerase I [Coxiellaceae bacterium]